MPHSTAFSLSSRTRDVVISAYLEYDRCKKNVFFSLLQQFIFNLGGREGDGNRVSPGFHKRFKSGLNLQSILT